MSVVTHGIFVCPNCRTGEFERTIDSWICGTCGDAYPVEAGVPLLVSAPAAHRARLQSQQASNPDWYVVPQPPEDVSPWRHHLRKRRRYVVKQIHRYLRQRGMNKFGRVLDLGCGDGNNLDWLQEYAEKIYGSDYNGLRLLRAAQRNTDAILFLADALDYPIAENAFDAVFFNHVIEHIADDLSALATVRRILKPGGLLILGTPNEGCWWWQWAYRRAPKTLRGTDHVHFYTGLTIGSKLIKAGFDLVETKYLGWGPPDWALDGRIRQYRWVDDLFEVIGRVLLPRQSSSLYVIAIKDSQLS